MMTGSTSSRVAAEDGASQPYQVDKIEVLPRTSESKELEYQSAASLVAALKIQKTFRQHRFCKAYQNMRGSRLNIACLPPDHPCSQTHVDFVVSWGIICHAGLLVFLLCMLGVTFDSAFSAEYRDNTWETTTNSSLRLTLKTSVCALFQSMGTTIPSAQQRAGHWAWPSHSGLMNNTIQKVATIMIHSGTPGFSTIHTSRAASSRSRHGAI